MGELEPDRGLGQHSDAPRPVLNLWVSLFKMTVEPKPLLASTFAATRLRGCAELQRG